MSRVLLNDVHREKVEELEEATIVQVLHVDQVITQVQVVRRSPLLLDHLNQIQDEFLDQVSRLSRADQLDLTIIHNVHLSRLQLVHHNRIQDESLVRVSRHNQRQIDQQVLTIIHNVLLNRIMEE